MSIEETENYSNFFLKSIDTRKKADTLLINRETLRTNHIKMGINMNIIDFTRENICCCNKIARESFWLGTDIINQTRKGEY
ncbi:MAG: hypothetical protein N4A63_09940 [Vallitalea sp.]|jgi:hypothetical protein|nr:hypothetical protein [Vallitalea sp.]